MSSTASSRASCEGALSRLRAPSCSGKARISRIKARQDVTGLEEEPDDYIVRRARIGGECRRKKRRRRREGEKRRNGPTPKDPIARPSPLSTPLDARAHLPLFASCFGFPDCAEQGNLIIFLPFLTTFDVYCILILTVAALNRTTTLPQGP